jgi:very-short-patch-repair endonuclease
MTASALAISPRRGEDSVGAVRAPSPRVRGPRLSGAWTTMAYPPSPLRGEGRVRGVCESPRDYARALRRRQTDAERRLWSRLRDRRLLGAKFVRQMPIGPYVVDFCCREARLIVELDGGQHAGRAAYDAARTALLRRFGYRVLRFWDNDTLTNTAGVLEGIVEALGAAPSPRPSPPGGEGEGSA